MVVPEFQVARDRGHHVGVARALLADVEAHEGAAERLDAADRGEDDAVRNAVVAGLEQAAVQQLELVEQRCGGRVAAATVQRVHHILLVVAEAVVQQLARLVQPIAHLRGGRHPERR